MSTIIAGRFELQTQAEEVMMELMRLGFPREHLSSFFVNPAGQHGAYPIGGDRAMSPGAKESDKSVATGAAVGAAIGVAATPVLGPVGTVTGGLLGAHLGGLVGGLSGMKEQGDQGNEHDVENVLPQRKAGMLVAVRVQDDDHMNDVINLFRSMGAEDLERAEGTLENGDWADFDPIAPVALIHGGNERRVR
ncbi:hypothetical protein [Noviherbaspirillum sp.]|mgnify:CR=1 FL=1|uniref:hypothetical protein n=1 Tax=Noviherbaspirillum sp. TaxID=1926288 RepID=UPI002FE0ABB7